MNIALSLIGLGFDPEKDFIVQDDGEGQFIKEWKSKKPEPSKKEMKEGLKKGEKLEKENEARLQKLVNLQEVFKSNLKDIDVLEQQEFSLFFNLSDQGFEPDLKNYPRINAQIKEWEEKGIKV